MVMALLLLLMGSSCGEFVVDGVVAAISSAFFLFLCESTGRAQSGLLNCQIVEFGEVAANTTSSLAELIGNFLVGGACLAALVVAMGRGCQELSDGLRLLQYHVLSSNLLAVLAMQPTI